MKDVVVLAGVTALSMSIAWVFFRYPGLSKNDPWGRGIKWGAASSVLIFGVAALVAAVRLVL